MRNEEETFGRRRVRGQETYAQLGEECEVRRPAHNLAKSARSGDLRTTWRRVRGQETYAQLGEECEVRKSAYTTSCVRNQ